MRSRITFVTAILSIQLLVACAHQGPLTSGPWSVIDGADNIVSMQKELEKPSFALDKVVVIRFMLEGKRLEVTSVAPTVIVAQPAAGNRTVLNFNDRKKLVLFSRDGRHIKGYRMEIDAADLTVGRSITFPIAQDPGEVVEKTLSVEQVIVQ